MNVAEFEREARDALVKFPFLKRMEIVDIHREAIKLRLYAKENLFVQAYFNSATGTKIFVAILSNERIFGRDCDQKGWHRHTFECPVGHDFSSEGRKEVSITEFLEELQEIIERADLL